MLITRKSIPRRAFLRGAGAALALPMLDAMTPALAAAKARPIRMAFVEVPNGIMMDKWTPAAEGDLQLSPVLEPLAQFRDRMLVLGGLDQKEAAALGFEIGGDHPRACSAWLTGAHARMTAGADLRAGISVDQVAAREFGKYTQLASLELGLESSEVVGTCESAYSCAAGLAHPIAARSTSIWRRCATSSVACSWRRNRTAMNCRRSQDRLAS